MTVPFFFFIIHCITDCFTGCTYVDTPRSIQWFFRNELLDLQDRIIIVVNYKGLLSIVLSGHKYLKQAQDSSLNKFKRNVTGDWRG